MDLQTALARFDGKHTESLREAAQIAAESQCRGLVEACFDPDLTVAATWVVKHLVETNQAKHIDLTRAIQALPGNRWPDAQLHLLQMVQHAPAACLGQTTQIRALLDAKKTLVRVWALDAFVRLATLQPVIQTEAKVLVKAAVLDERASMRARARDLTLVCASWDSVIGG